MLGSVPGEAKKSSVTVPALGDDGWTLSAAVGVGAVADGAGAVADDAGGAAG